uniref:Replication protein A 70 kDa DNA-binding subunit B n=1 Tax=Tanacetum cinerariifolium TaxID=118510 RepID=A0A6L2KZC3_TANCI|nr:hypothetical protein [Tanacetum cinerariifolium]
MSYIHPDAGDLYYQRMLLSHQRGCWSFQDIRMVNYVVYPTCRAICEAMGLLGDDTEWEGSLKEVASTATPSQLRILLAHIFTHCQVLNPLDLWKRTWNLMSNDIPYVASVSLDFGIPLPPEDLMSVLQNRTMEEASVTAICQQDKGKNILTEAEITNILRLEPQCKQTGLRDAEYFDQLLQLKKAYRFTGFSCEPTDSWERTLPTEITLSFGRYLQAEEIATTDFPEHYFNFAAYNELSDRLAAKNPTLTVGRIVTTGNATATRKTRRAIDIENLSGNTIGFTLWDEMALNFNVREYDSMGKLVIIAVSSCYINRYNGLPQKLLSILSAHKSVGIMKSAPHVDKNSKKSNPFQNARTMDHKQPKLTVNVNDGSATTSITCFSDQANTLTRDVNKVLAKLTDKNPFTLPPSLKELEGSMYARIKTYVPDGYTIRTYLRKPKPRQYTKRIKEQEELIDMLSDQLAEEKNTIKIKQTTILELKECLRKKDFENEHLKSKVSDFTMVQNLRTLNLTVEELSKARALAEEILKQRDEKNFDLEDKRMILAKNEFFEKVSSSAQKEYNDLLASNDVLKQRLEMKFKFLKHDTSLEKMIEMIKKEYESNILKIFIKSSTFETKNLKLVKEMGDKAKCFDEEKRVFETKISKLEKVLAQQVKDLDDVKTKLSNRTHKFEIYFTNLEKQNALIESQLASQNYTSLQKKNNNLRTSYNVLKEKYETSYEKLKKENIDLKMHYKRLFDSIKQKKVDSQVFTKSISKVYVSENIYTGTSLKPLFEKGIMETMPDIENMTLNEYLEYEVEKERRLWDNVQSRRSPNNYDEVDVDSFYQNKNKILNVAMFDEEADLTRDIKEPERLLVKDPYFTEIQVHSVITKPEPFIQTQQ